MKKGRNVPRPRTLGEVHKYRSARRSDLASRILARLLDLDQAVGKARYPARGSVVTRTERRNAEIALST